jgi:CDGSH-type Zn-finger protein
MEFFNMSEPIVIRCRDNGPFVIKTPVQVVDHDGKPFTIPAGKETIALCRCGASKNKPFCDGAHNGCGFQAGEKAPV